MKITLQLIQKHFPDENISNDELQHINEIISEVWDIIDRKGYWLWECWYYFNEHRNEMIEDWFSEERARIIMNIAENMADYVL